MNLLIPGNLTEPLKLFVASMLMLATMLLVTSPKITTTWQVLSSFIYAFLLECWLCFITWLKEAKRKIRTISKMIVFTRGREWLDETEARITE